MEGTPIWLHHANHPPAHQGNTHTHNHTYKYTHRGLLLHSHKVTECQYKCAPPSNKWDLACSINSAAKSLLLSITELYLTAEGRSYLRLLIVPQTSSVYVLCSWIISSIYDLKQVQVHLQVTVT